jgi:pimeloyl-ACP methyl ester carboxylesterase
MSRKLNNANIQNCVNEEIERKGYPKFKDAFAPEIVYSGGQGLELVSNQLFDKQGILFLHGFRTALYSRTLDYLVEATKQGLFGASFSFQGHGLSEGRRGYMTESSVIEDTLSAVNYMHDAGAEDVHIFASSIGAIGALGAALSDRRVKSLVLMSPFTNLDHFKDKNLLTRFNGGYNYLVSLRQAYEGETDKDKKLRLAEEIDDFEYVQLETADENKGEWWLQQEVPLDSFPEWKAMDALKLAKEVTASTLVIYGKNDDWMTSESMTLMHDYLRSVKKKELGIDGGHGLQSEEARQLVVDEMFKWFADCYKD